MINGIFSRLMTDRFSIDDLTFDYSKVPSDYHADPNPEREITLYKGAPRGYSDKGLRSMALRMGLPSHVRKVKELIEQGDHFSIEKLLDRHTSYYHYTALLSATFNPEAAQVFAPTGHSPLVKKVKKDSTIYEIKIKANRCIMDCYDTGNCGVSKELLILGSIFPEEISRVKVINDDEHSELLYSFNGGSRIRYWQDANSINRTVKDPDNWADL